MSKTSTDRCPKHSSGAHIRPLFDDGGTWDGKCMDCGEQIESPNPEVRERESLEEQLECARREAEQAENDKVRALCERDKALERLTEAVRKESSATAALANVRKVLEDVVPTEQRAEHVTALDYALAVVARIPILQAEIERLSGPGGVRVRTSHIYRGSEEAKKLSDDELAAELSLRCDVPDPLCGLIHEAADRLRKLSARAALAAQNRQLAENNRDAAIACAKRVDEERAEVGRELEAALERISELDDQVAKLTEERDGTEKHFSEAAQREIEAIRERDSATAERDALRAQLAERDRQVDREQYVRAVLGSMVREAIGEAERTGALLRSVMQAQQAAAQAEKGAA